MSNASEKRLQACFQLTLLVLCVTISLPATTRAETTAAADGCGGNPCMNGLCVAADNGFRCDCGTSGYQGDVCDTDINECVTVNQCNNGSCENTVGSFLCICNDGYTGDRCEEISGAASANSEATVLGLPSTQGALLAVALVVLIIACIVGGVWTYRNQARQQATAASDPNELKSVENRPPSGFSLLSGDSLSVLSVGGTYDAEPQPATVAATQSPTVAVAQPLVGASSTPPPVVQPMGAPPLAATMPATAVAPGFQPLEKVYS